VLDGGAGTLELSHQFAMGHKRSQPLLGSHASDFLGQATSGSLGQLRFHVAM
jgi:hypothetical protein